MKSHRAEPKKFFLPISIFIILFVPTIIVGAYFYNVINVNLTNQVFTQREMVAGLSASALKVKLDHLASIVESYASDTTIIDDVAAGNWDGAKTELINLQNDPGNYDYFIDRSVFLNASGSIEASFPGMSQSKLGQPDRAIAEWYDPLMTEGRSYFVTDVFGKQSIPRVNRIEIVAPIKQASKIIGFAEITVPINSFSDFGKDVDITDDGFVYIVDRLGHIVSHPKYASDDPIVDYSSITSVKNLIAGRSGTLIDYNRIEQQNRVVAYELVPTYNWGVVSIEPTSEAFANRDHILNVIISTTCAATLIELILALLLIYLLNHKHEEKK